MYAKSSDNSNHMPSNINTSTSITATLATATATTTNLPSMLPSTPAPDPIKVKWMKNLSSRPVTRAQFSHLARANTLPVVPLYSSKGEYSTAVEKVCQLLPKEEECVRVVLLGYSYTKWALNSRRTKATRNIAMHRPKTVPVTASTACKSKV